LDLAVQNSFSRGAYKTRCLLPLSTGKGVWFSPNVSATNLYNLAIVPGGTRFANGLFDKINEQGAYLQIYNSNTIRNVIFSYSSDSFISVSSPGTERNGVSIRLVRPTTPAELNLPNGTTSNQNPQLPHYLDNSGRTYITVKIGNRVWMAQNLMDTRLNNGTIIDEGLDDIQWNSTIDPACCTYNNQLTFNNGSVLICGVSNQPLPTTTTSTSTTTSTTSTTTSTTTIKPTTTTIKPTTTTSSTTLPSTHVCFILSYCLYYKASKYV
jgi:hypothetical protein